MPEAAAIRRMFAGISRRYDLLNRLLSLGVDRRWRRRLVAALARGTGADAAVRSPAGVEFTAGASPGLPPKHPSTPMTALDMCCGTGDLSLDLAASGYRVTGIDFCHEMLAIARRKAARNARLPGGAAFRVAEADALRLPFRDGTFAVAAVAFGVRNLEDLDAGLREIARVLAAGGRLAVLEFGRPRAPVVGTLYSAYLRGFVPLLGRLISGDGGAYAYLSSSIQAFPDQSEFPERLRRAGFTDVRCEDLTLGVAALYTATKPAV